MPRQGSVMERSKGEDVVETKKSLVTKMEPMDCKAWRCVESLELLDVTGPELGNSQLPALTKTAEGDAAAAKMPADAMQPGAGGETKYHDVFTVQIRIVAHAKVVEQFMRTILQSKDIFYVPISMSVKTYDDQQTMADYQLLSPAVVGAPGERGYRNRPAIPLFTVAGFEHEPPVQADLVYKVYRFRFADTKNQMPQVAPTGMGQNY